VAIRYHIGAKDLRGDISAYAKRFDFLEVRVPSAGDLRLAPSEATLRKWRKAVPPHFEFAVVLSHAAGLLKPSPALEAELKCALGMIKALQARTVVICTPPDVTPAPVWRNRLKAFVERLPKDASQLVWEPKGLWETDEAARFGRTLGLTLAVDPAREPVPEGPVAYGRLRSLGEVRSFGQTALERVVRAIGDRRDAFIVIETDAALSECKTLRRVAQKGVGNLGGGGLVLRPRGGAPRPDDDE
jgi:uncharacterized protein YecE (DUF72 family)